MASIKDTFIKRKEYIELNNNFQYPDLPSLYTSYYLDSWEVSPFYGKVDTFGIPVMPNLKQIKHCSYANDKNKVTVLEPFNNFYLPFREEYLDNYAIGAINKGSAYFSKDIPPVKGFINGNLEFEQKIKNLYSNYVQFLISNNKINYIKNFEDFTFELLNYVKTNNLYLTRAGYVESYDYSLLHTGLAVEIIDQKSSNDEERINFFNDVNHDAYLELCIRSNLKIDRQIPWRVYVDIRTKSSDGTLNFKTEIQKYIPDFKDDIQLFFETFYTRVVPYDKVSYPYFTEFVNILKAFYLSFTTSYPKYVNYNINLCGKANVEKTLRDTQSSATIEKYVDLYLKFRSAELNKVVDKNQLEFYAQTAFEIFLTSQSKYDPQSVINSIKYYTDNVGNLAYRNPSLYELDQNQKTP